MTFNGEGFRALKQKVIDSPIWRSIFRGGVWRDTPRDRAQHILGNVFLHLHPVFVRRHALKFNYTWGLGGISFLLFLILTVTGVVLMFVYTPSVERAYNDMKDLKYVVPFGVLLRNLHRWSAHAMVLTLWLHMLVVFLRGGHKCPREFNWVLGVALLLATLLLSFTGYLLPWDQLAYWAITVGTNMAAAVPFLGAAGPFSFVDSSGDMRFALLGGTIIGQNALIRFYTWHCLALPLVAFAIMCVHFWRVRKDRLSGPPGDTNNPEDRLTTWPHLVRIEFLGAILTVVILLAWSYFVNAPLEEPANPTLTPNPAKAPWYFLGLQELLVYFDPWIAGVMIPNIIVFGLAAIPYLDTDPPGVGSYAFRQRPLAISLFLAGYVLWFGLIVIGFSFRGPGWTWYWPWETWYIPKPVYEKTWDFPWSVGLPLLMSYFGLGIFLPYRKIAALRTLGRVRYVVSMFLFLLMLAVPLKIVLRLLWHVHYVLRTPWFNI